MFLDGFRGSGLQKGTKKYMYTYQSTYIYIYVICRQIVDALTILSLYWVVDESQNDVGDKYKCKGIDQPKHHHSTPSSSATPAKKATAFELSGNNCAHFLLPSFLSLLFATTR